MVTASPHSKNTKTIISHLAQYLIQNEHSITISDLKTYFLSSPKNIKLCMRGK